MADLVQKSELVDIFNAFDGATISLNDFSEKASELISLSRTLDGIIQNTGTNVWDDDVKDGTNEAGTNLVTEINNCKTDADYIAAGQGPVDTLVSAVTEYVTQFKNYETENNRTVREYIKPPERLTEADQESKEIEFVKNPEYTSHINKLKAYVQTIGMLQEECETIFGQVKTYFESYSFTTHNSTANVAASDIERYVEFDKTFNEIYNDLMDKSAEQEQAAAQVAEEAAAAAQAAAEVAAAAQAAEEAAAVAQAAAEAAAAAQAAEELKIKQQETALRMLGFDCDDYLNLTWDDINNNENKYDELIESYSGFESEDDKQKLTNVVKVEKEYTYEENGVLRKGVATVYINVTQPNRNEDLEYTLLAGSDTFTVSSTSEEGEVVLYNGTTSSSNYGKSSHTTAYTGESTDSKDVFYIRDTDEYNPTANLGGSNFISAVDKYERVEVVGNDNIPGTVTETVTTVDQNGIPREVDISTYDRDDPRVGKVEKYAYDSDGNQLGKGEITEYYLEGDTLMKKNSVSNNAVEVTEAEYQIDIERWDLNNEEQYSNNFNINSELDRSRLSKSLYLYAHESNMQTVTLYDANGGSEKYGLGEIYDVLMKKFEANEPFKVTFEAADFDKKDTYISFNFTEVQDPEDQPVANPTTPLDSDATQLNQDGGDGKASKELPPLDSSNHHHYKNGGGGGGSSMDPLVYTNYDSQGGWRNRLGI